MKKTKKFWAVLAAAGLLAASFAGCGSNAKSDDSDKKQWECLVSDESPMDGALKFKMAFRIAEAEGK